LRGKLKSIEEFRKYIHRSSNGTYLLTTHKNADPDAIASIIVLRNYLRANKKHIFITLPEGMNTSSKNLLENMSIDLEYFTPSLISGLKELIDAVIVVDTSSSVQLGDLWSIIRGKQIIVIDHHRMGDLADKSLYYIGSNLVSTCELVYILLRDSWWFNRIESTLLLAGILYDSRRFMYVDEYVFSIVDELISIYDADYVLANKSLQRKMDYSERIARLKGAQRLKIYRIKEYVVGITHVSAFEGSVARAIIDLGADIAFVVSERDHVLRIVGRASQGFVRETNISLGRDIMPIIARYLNGSGGGHDTAGVAEGYGDIDSAYRIIINVLRKNLGFKY
jgi:nanoRNase/pAp phosphatase (c-di-AMP/oligoRNAs hydrolase)